MSRYGYAPFIFIGLGVIAFLLFIVVAFVQAQPATVIGPNGQITVIYPGQNGGPTVVLPPTGRPTFVYPGTPAPGVPVTPVPLPIAPLPALVPLTLPMLGGN